MINDKNRWIFRALFWGTFMFLCMQVLWPLSQSEILTFKGLLFGLLFWIAGGFVYSWIMRLINKEGKAAKADSTRSAS